MKLVSWNVNSLKVRADLVAAYLDEERPDVLCLQELKLTDEAVPRGLFEQRGYHLAIHGQKQWNGVLIASREPISDVHRGLAGGDEGQSRLIAATTFGIRVVNLYCPQGQNTSSPKFAYKLGFYDALISWLAGQDRSAPLAVLGDLNIAPTVADVWDVAFWRGKPSFHPDEHARWARLLGLGFEDAVQPHIQPGTFTFWDYRNLCFPFDKGMRIDHVLVTKALAGRVQGGFVHRAWRKKRGDIKASDHAPVGVELASS